MLNFRRLLSLVIPLLFLVIGPSVISLAQRLPVPASPTLHDRVSERGLLPVLVKLDVDYTRETLLSPNQAKRQRLRLTAFRHDLLQQLGEVGIIQRSESNTWMIPYIALWVNSDGLRKLERTPGVLEILEDIPSQPALTGSLGPTDTYEAHNLGFIGLDQVVAVIDSGINKNHPMLAEAVAGESCFSTSQTGQGVFSLCPNGTTTQTGGGAASSSTCAGLLLCDHGSYMSGIIAGAPYTAAGGTYKGLGFGAKVLAVQAYSRSTNPAYCAGQPTPCISSFTANQVSALQYVYDTRGNHNLAAVTLGFVGAFPASPSACNSDLRRGVIDALFDVGIATIIPSGNSGNIGNVASPACVANAITVGATDDARNVASFSNSSILVDLLAIGVDVQSAGGGISILEDDGTSAAAAMVAGAWAILKQVRPNAEVLVILDALQTTGIGVLDGRNGLTHKFIQVGEAIKLLQTLPAATNLITNAGFEAGAGTIATGWTQNGVGATRVCGTGSPLVYAGTCAAQLVYTGQAASFKQVFVQGGTNANYAWLSARVNKHAATGTILATLIGGDGKKLKLKLLVSGTGTYRLVSNTVPLKNQTYTVTLKMTITGGSYEVDNLYLSFQDTTATIP